MRLVGGHQRDADQRWDDDGGSPTSRHSQAGSLVPADETLRLSERWRHRGLLFASGRSSVNGIIIRIRERRWRITGRECRPQGFVESGLASAALRLSFVVMFHCPCRAAASISSDVTSALDAYLLSAHVPMTIRQALLCVRHWIVHDMLRHEPHL